MWFRLMCSVLLLGMTGCGPGEPEAPKEKKPQPAAATSTPSVNPVQSRDQLQQHIGLMRAMYVQQKGSIKKKKASGQTVTPEEEQKLRNWKEGLERAKCSLYKLDHPDKTTCPRIGNNP